jgi:glycosyltransferase involved in cell wall biosynthesis
MENIKKISVILPIYNGIKYLQLSVESVLSQNFTDFDFLICDDCSTDESFKYLQTLTDNRIKLFRNEQNKGLFPTLNYLLKQTKSELVHLWAQDDIMYPDCLAETIKFHLKFPNVSFSFSRWHTINDKGKITGKVFECNDHTITPEGHAKSSILYGSIAGNIANVTIVKKEIERVGYFDDTMKYSGDFDMWYKLSKNNPVGISEKYLIKLRNHSQQLSRNINASYYRLNENLAIYQNFISLLNPEKQKVTRKALKWKIYPQYFSQLLYILLKRKFTLAKKYFISLRKYDNLLILFFRWIFIKILKIIKFEYKFYQKYIINKF